MASVRASEWTHDYLAQTLCAKFGSNFRWCYSKNAWLVWNGKFWQQDPGFLMERYTQELSVWILGEADKEQEDDKARKEMRSVALTLQNQATIKNVLAAAQRQAGMPIHGSELNPPSTDFLFNCLNGTLNMATGEFTRHHERYRDRLITVMAPVVWRGAEFRHPELSKFLRIITAGEVEMLYFLQRAAFASFTGDTSDKCFVNPFDQQLGGTGKTQLTQILLSTLGEYGCVVSPNAFLEQRGAGIAADLATIDGKRMVVSDEMPPRARFDGALMKRLTKGSGVFKFERKYENPWEGRITSTIWIDGNGLASAMAEDTALFARWKMVEFLVQIPAAGRVNGWSDKMAREPDFLSAVLAMVMRGAPGWHKEGIGTFARITESVAEARADMDPLNEFWREYCEFGNPKHCETNEDLYDAMTAWAHENNVRAPGKKVFYALLDAQPHTKREHFQSKTQPKNHRGVDIYRRRGYSGVALHFHKQSSKTSGSGAVKVESRGKYRGK